jgi:hypothetical protein
MRVPGGSVISLIATLITRRDQEAIHHAARRNATRVIIIRLYIKKTQYFKKKFLHYIPVKPPLRKEIDVERI